MIRVAITGSRSIKDKDLIKQSIIQGMINLFEGKDFLLEKERFVFVLGGALGVDKIAEEIIDEWKIQKNVFIPEWNKFGKKAGFLRNEVMAKNSDWLIGIWDGKSNGTRHMIEFCRNTHKSFVEEISL